MSSQSKARKVGSRGDGRRAVLPLRRSMRQQKQKEDIGTASVPLSNSSSPARDVVVATSKGFNKRLPPTNDAVPLQLPALLPGLTKEGTNLLRYKNQQLRSSTSQLHKLHVVCERESPDYPALENAVYATLVFAQEEAGTAVCISPDGLLLTCSHCVAENEEALDLEKLWWLLFADGRVVQAKTVRWDPRRDLALLRIVAFQSSANQARLILASSASVDPCILFPSVSLAAAMPEAATPLICIGQPGSEDLEVGRPGIATGYDVLHISSGKFCGYAEGQDPQDNSEIGALMHDCWTYWGHSGAPLVERGSGTVVGVHSSWDDETGMRRGVGLEAMKAFLEEECKVDCVELLR